MATIPPVGSWSAPGCHRVEWDGLTGSGDICLGASDINLPYKTINVFGTYGSAGVVTIQGSNATDRDAANDWVALNDINGAPLAFTADRMETIAENPRWIRPRASGATGGGFSVKVVMISV